MKGDICKIKDCKNIITIKGHICGKHLSRFWKYRDYNYISSNWTNLRKGQPHLTNYGYLVVNNGKKRVLQHRFIMEQYLGRKLKPQERIHHINHIRTDNRIENLKVIKNQAEHIRKHHTLIWKKRKKNKELSQKLKNEIIYIANNHIRKHKKHICKVSSCNNISRTRDLCSKHYLWYFKHFLH